MDRTWILKLKSFEGLRIMEKHMEKQMEISGKVEPYRDI